MAKLFIFGPRRQICTVWRVYRRAECFTPTSMEERDGPDWLLQGVICLDAALKFPEDFEASVYQDLL